ncbi:hypothetical protein MC28_2683 [Bacillus thuringiensis MC28]|nr:hypothetical protein MC28_2683 [Bacillus thuringiensis MC28]
MFFIYLMVYNGWKGRGYIKVTNLLNLHFHKNMYRHLQKKRVI